MLTHGKCSNKITVQRDDGAALLLRIVLFVQRSAIKLYTKEIGEGCVRSERQLLFLALRDRCTITGRDFRGQLCRYGLSLGDFLCCFGVLVILVAAVAVPVFDIALRSLCCRLCIYMLEVGVVVRVKLSVALAADLANRLVLAGRFAAGVLVLNGTFFSAENAKPSAVFALTISLKLVSVAGYVDAFMMPLYKPFSTVGVRGPSPNPINLYP